jgi:chloramphenicol-sensitive protein RarD
MSTSVPSGAAAGNEAAGADSVDQEVAARHRLGLIFGFAAYSLWGLFPLYWNRLAPATPLEILCDRFIWSLVFLIILMTVTRTWSRLRPVVASRRSMLLLAVASVLIGVNWGVYIWAVSNQHVVEGALGYFINPLVLVVVGTVFLGEKLRRLQWIAVGLAVIAVVVTTFGYGRLPWIALILAFSFAGYGVIKKVADVDPIASLTIETAYVSPLCLAYLIFLASSNSLVFGHSSARETLLLAGAGVVTAIPLLLFSGAAIRIPLSTMGLLQYLTPSIQFFLGIFLMNEHMSPVLLTGFLIVWAALALFTFDSLRNGQRTRSMRTAHTIADDVEAPI